MKVSLARSHTDSLTRGSVLIECDREQKFYSEGDAVVSKCKDLHQINKTFTICVPEHFFFFQDAERLSAALESVHPSTTLTHCTAVISQCFYVITGPHHLFHGGETHFVAFYERSMHLQLHVVFGACVVLMERD